MLSSFFLSLREGLEAALIVGVLLGTLKKTNNLKYKSAIWSGVGIASVLSILIGYLLNRLGASFEGQTEQIFEGVAMLLAAGMLTWVIIWMQSQFRSAKLKLEDSVKLAVLEGSRFALFSLAFIAVIREGIELAVFLTAASMDVESSQILIGAVLGLLTVVALGILLFKSLISLDLAKFFNITSIILILFAAGLVAHGVHEFNEAGVIPSVIEHVWDMNHILDEKSTPGLLLKALIGYNGNPSLTEVISYFLYFIFLWLIVRGDKKKEYFSVNGT